MSCSLVREASVEDARRPCSSTCVMLVEGVMRDGDGDSRVLSRRTRDGDSRWEAVGDAIPADELTNRLTVANRAPC